MKCMRVREYAVYVSLHICIQLFMSIKNKPPHAQLRGASTARICNIWIYVCLCVRYVCAHVETRACTRTLNIWVCVDM